MLTELRISNFALIDQLHLEFPSGFLVFTGETGTGKSLLIDALILLTGGRSSVEHVRFGAEEALLEACFILKPLHPLVSGYKKRVIFFLANRRSLFADCYLGREKIEVT